MWMLVSMSSNAQSQNFESRYNLLVSQLGPAGVGVETLLTKWEKADSTNKRMLLAKFDYYFAKSQTESIVQKPNKKYLGMDPLFSLKDSSNVSVYYYREVFYDDDLYASALKAADRLISLYPDDLDYRFLKANTLVAYEKESPDMALSYLLDLIRQDVSRVRPWNFEDKKMDPDFLPDAMQEYCRTFYLVGSDSSLDAFYTLSERLYELYPGMVCFLSNMATYHLVAKDDPKTALKYYGKVLKKVKDDETALRNSMVAARKSGNRKLEEKYRQQLVKYGYLK